MISAASEKKLIGVKPGLVRITRRAAEISKQPFQIVQGNRTQAEQNAIYAQGRTKPGTIVTWTRNSKHIGGNAVDFAALVNGKISWDARYYPTIGKAFKQAATELKAKITWGGDWKARDWGHIQLDQDIAVEKGYSNPLKAVELYKGLGWSREAAVALVANLVWESGGNTMKPPLVIYGAHGDKGTDGKFHSHGAGQWNDKHGRYDELLRYARERGTAWNDPETQLRYLDHELKSTEKGAATKLWAAKTLEEAVNAAILIWRPGIPHADRRLAIARSLYEKD